MSRQALIVQAAGEPDQVLEQTLQRYGYGRLSNVATVAEALAALEEEGTDLLIVPIDEVDEMQLAALDRVNRRDRDMGVIATGPRADPELMLRAMRAGIQEFLVRPLDATDLTTAVERVFRRSSTTVAGGQVYAVFGAKGGVGTSTVAVNLSYALSRV
jgi:pilus assembly protein CpaE